MWKLIKQAWSRYYTVRWLAVVLNTYACAFIVEVAVSDKPNWFAIVTVIIGAVWIVAALALTIISLTEYPRENWRNHRG